MTGHHELTHSGRSVMQLIYLLFRVCEMTMRLFNWQNVQEAAVYLQKKNSTGIKVNTVCFMEIIDLDRQEQKFKQI